MTGCIGAALQSFGRFILKQVRQKILIHDPTETGPEMDISRKGAERNRGRTDIITGLTFTSSKESSWNDNVRWNTHAKAILINAYWIQSTDGKSHHNYTIKLTLDDIAALVELVGHAGAKTDAKLLRDSLAKNIPAIVKLLACATGVQPLEIREEDVDDENQKKPVLPRRIAVKKAVPRRS